MGILPYQTPVEHSRMNRRIQHFNDFCKLKGYEILFDRGWGPHPWQDEAGVTHTTTSRPWVGKNGQSYIDREQFRKDNGWYPYLIKDGVCYGWYEPKEIDGYIEPFEDECKFLEALGYGRLKEPLSKDYIENNNLEDAFYKRYGWVPRWEINETMYGHEDLLVKHGYEYKGEPSLPLLTEAEKKLAEKKDSGD